MNRLDQYKATHKMSKTQRRRWAWEYSRCEDEKKECEESLIINKEKLEELENHKNVFESIFAEESKKIENEESNDYVLCYRNGVKYKRNLLDILSAPQSKNVKGNTAAPKNINTINNGKNAYKQYDDFYSSKTSDFFDVKVRTFEGRTYSTIKFLNEKWNRKDNESEGGLFNNAACYADNESQTLESLNKFAAERGVGLYEDIKTAFKLPDGTDEKDFMGIYNGGEFKTTQRAGKDITVSVDDDLFGEVEVDAKTEIYDITHEVQYYSSLDGGQIKDTSYTKSIEVVNVMDGGDEQDMYIENISYTGERVPLLVIEKYE